MANTHKAFEKYLIDVPHAHKTSLEAYSNRPAEAFLVSVCDAHDAFNNCLKKFIKKKDGDYNKDSVDSLRQISLALLGGIMGHFETFQKALFAGLIERSSNFEAFNEKNFIKNIGGDDVISPSSLLAFRSEKAPVGFVIADSIGRWHEPCSLNSRLRALGIMTEYFGSQEVSDLKLLWQLRHTIVHTGAWLTKPDAQKVNQLSKFGDRALAFEPMFINAVARRFHRIVKVGNTRLEVEVLKRLGQEATTLSIEDVRSFLEVRSPTEIWLR